MKRILMPIFVIFLLLPAANLAIADTNGWADYCKEGKAALKRSPLANREFPGSRVASKASKGVLYIPVGAMAVPVFGPSDGEIVAMYENSHDKDSMLAFFNSRGQPVFVVSTWQFSADKFPLPRAIGRDAAFSIADKNPLRGRKQCEGRDRQIEDAGSNSCLCFGWRRIVVVIFSFFGPIQLVTELCWTIMPRFFVLCVDEVSGVVQTLLLERTFIAKRKQGV